MNSNFEYIQRYYGVPAKKGQRVEYNGRPGVIVGSHNQYIKIRFDGEAKVKGVYHPTDCIKYFAA